MGGIHGGKTAISYKVLNNNNGALSLLFNESSCGMTCAYWNRYYNFNPQNGDRYFLPDFFSDANFIQFKKIVTDRRLQDIRNQIERLKETDSSVYIKYMEEYIYSSISNDNLEGFYFTEDSLFFDSWNLFHKNDKFYDLNTTTKIAVSEIKNLLNDYGKEILEMNGNIAKFHATTEPQLYEGTIGKRNSFFLLFRNLYENTYEGVYAYKNQGQAIYLGTGKLVDGIFNFEENSTTFEKTGKITFKKKQDSLSGFWNNTKGEKATFEAKRL